MTTILVALDVPTPTGKAPAEGTLYFTRTRRNVDGRVTLAATFPVELVDGQASVVLDPTAPDEFVQVQENTRSRHTRNVAVPNSATPVRYTDLVDVDPATLTPTPANLAGWAAHLAAFEAIRDDIMQAVALYTIAQGGNN